MADSKSANQQISKSAISQAGEEVEPSTFDLQPAVTVRRSSVRRLPAKFGAFGGQFVPETLMPALAELEAAYLALQADAAFQVEFDGLLRTYVGRPTPLTHARRLTAHAGGAQIYLKREDLAHSGAHKINNALGQALLAQRMGKRQSSRRRARDSMAWHRPPRPRCWGWSASSTWARWISPASSRTCCG